MPIRINLLAEAQAEEESRRKDPVKRAIVISAVLVMAVVTWCGILQFQIIAAKADLRGFEVKWGAIESGYQEAVTGQRDLMDAERKLAALDNLRTNRFLWGTVLNAFQQSMNGVDKIRVVRLKGDQLYTLREATPGRTNGAAIIPPQPARSVERITIAVEAQDTSSQAGGQVNRFKEAILAVPYFEDGLQKTNGVLLTSLSPPQTDAETGGPFVKFTLQCHFPEKVR